MRTSGWVVFAAIMLIVAGIFGAINGLVAILNDEVYLVGEEVTIGMDFTQWGWIHFIVGLVVVCAGIGVMSGQRWAQVVGIAVATLHAVSMIWWIQVAPFWTMTILAIDVAVIYGLAVHGDEVEPTG
jgi:hypothetical protein